MTEPGRPGADDDPALPSGPLAGGPEAAAQETPSGEGGAGRVLDVVHSALRRPASGAMIGAALMFVTFSLIARPNFLTLPSMASTLTLAAELGIVAMGVTILMIGGEFDLSVGSVLGVSSVTVPWLAERGWPVAAAIPVALLVAISIGILNGIVVNRTRVPSFIVTLGALFWWRGVLFAVTRGFPISVDRDDPAFNLFSTRLGSGFNVSLFWFVAVTAILTLVVVRTRFGNWTFATGGNERTADQLGIPTKRVKLVLFALAAFLAGLAGIIQAGRFSGVDSLRGTAMELEAVAAAVIGGTRLSGGYGSVIGTAFGCIMLGIIQNGLVLAGIAGYWYRAFIGLLIVIVVIVNQRGGRVTPPA
jgi:simple sugar transport system permease protein